MEDCSSFRNGETYRTKSTVPGNVVFLQLVISGDTECTADSTRGPIANQWCSKSVEHNTSAPQTTRLVVPGTHLKVYVESKAIVYYN